MIDASFCNQTNQQHHHNISPLTHLPIDMKKGFSSLLHAPRLLRCSEVIFTGLDQSQERSKNIFNSHKGYKSKAVEFVALHSKHLCYEVTWSGRDLLVESN